MDTTFWIGVAIVAAVVVVAIVAWFVWRARRARRLRERYGAEYEHLVSEYGDTRRAVAALEAREKRARQLSIRSLSDDERDRFAAAWRGAQAQFLDEPRAALQEADRLVVEIMRARGYPAETFDQCVEHISVDHPRAASEYRLAHAALDHHEHAEQTTEDLRQAMIHYRALFDDLLVLREKEVA